MNDEDPENVECFASYLQPARQASFSTQVATELASKIAGAKVTVRELWRNPPPPVQPGQVHAVYTPEAARTSSSARCWRSRMNSWPSHLAADIVIVAAGLINFGIPSPLKAWIDLIARAGKTFRYSEAGAEGLVTGKKLVLVLSSGGVYSSGPMASFDHMGPYLRNTLGFLGMTDVETVMMEGSVFGPEAAEKALAAGRERAAGVAAAIGG